VLEEQKLLQVLIVFVNFIKIDYSVFEMGVMELCTGGSAWERARSQVTNYNCTLRFNSSKYF